MSLRFAVILLFENIVYLSQAKSFNLGFNEMKFC